MEVPLDKQLEDLLYRFRYESRSCPGVSKGLLPYHVTALKKDLLPFIEQYAESQADVIVTRRKEEVDKTLRHMFSKDNQINQLESELSYHQFACETCKMYGTCIKRKDLEDDLAKLK